MALGTRPLVFDDGVVGATRNDTPWTIELAAEGYVGSLKPGNPRLLLKLGNKTIVETRKPLAFNEPQVSH